MPPYSTPHGGTTPDRARRTPALFRETAAGIPNARLMLYVGQGHPVAGKQLERDILAFLGAG